LDLRMPSMRRPARACYPADRSTLPLRLFRTGRKFHGLGRLGQDGCFP
jgi:hypothetical protein